MLVLFFAIRDVTGAQMARLQFGLAHAGATEYKSMLFQWERVGMPVPHLFFPAQSKSQKLQKTHVRSSRSSIYSGSSSLRLLYCIVFKYLGLYSAPQQP